MTSCLWRRMPAILMITVALSCKHSKPGRLYDNKDTPASDGENEDEKLKRQLKESTEEGRPDGISDGLWEDLKREQQERLEILTRLQAAEDRAVEWFGEDSVLAKEIINGVRKQYAGRPGAARNIVVIGWPGQAKTLITKKLAEWLGMGSDRFKIISITEGSRSMPIEFIKQNLVNAEKRTSILPVLYVVDEAQRLFRKEDAFDLEAERAKLEREIIKPLQEAVGAPPGPEADYNSRHLYDARLQQVSVAQGQITQKLAQMQAAAATNNASANADLQILRDTASADGTVEPLGGAVSGKKASQFLEDIKAVITSYKDYDFQNGITSDPEGDTDKSVKARHEKLLIQIEELEGKFLAAQAEVKQKSLNQTDDVKKAEYQAAVSQQAEIDAQLKRKRQEAVPLKQLLDAHAGILTQAQGAIQSALASYPELFSKSHFEARVGERWKISSRYLWLTRFFAEDPQGTYEHLKPIAEQLPDVDRKYGGHITTVEILNPLEIMAKVAALAGPNASKDRVAAVAREFLESQEGKDEIEKQLKTIFGEKDWDSFRKRLMELVIYPETQAQLETILTRIVSKNAAELAVKLNNRTKINYTKAALDIFFQVGAQKPDPRAAVATLESALISVYDKIEKDVLQKIQNREPIPANYEIGFDMASANLSADSIKDGNVRTRVADYKMAEIVAQAQRMAEEARYQMTPAEAFLKASRMVAVAYVGQLLTKKLAGTFALEDAEGLALMRNRMWAPPELGKAANGKKKRSWQYEINELVLFAAAAESDNIRFLDLSASAETILAEMKVRLSDVFELLRSSATANNLTGPDAVYELFRRGGVPDIEAYQALIDGASNRATADQVISRLRVYANSLLTPLMANNVTSVPDALKAAERVIDVITGSFLETNPRVLTATKTEAAIFRVLTKNANARLAGLGVKATLEFDQGTFETLLDLSKSRGNPKSSTEAMRKMIDILFDEIRKNVEARKADPKNNPVMPDYQVLFNGEGVVINAVLPSGKQLVTAVNMDGVAILANRETNFSANDQLLNASRLSAMGVAGSLLLHGLFSEISIDDIPGRDLIEKKMWLYPDAGKAADGTPKRNVEYDVYELVILAAGVESDMMQIARLDAGGERLLRELCVAAVEAVETIRAAAAEAGKTGPNAIADYIAVDLDPALLKTSLFKLIVEAAKKMEGTAPGPKLDPQRPNVMQDPRVVLVDGLVGELRKMAHSLLVRHMVGKAPNFRQMISGNKGKLIEYLNDELMRAGKLSPEQADAILRTKYPPRRTFFGLIKIPKWTGLSVPMFSPREAGSFRSSSCRLLMKRRWGDWFRRWAGQFVGAF